MSAIEPSSALVSGVLTVSPASADAPALEHALALAHCGLRIIFVHAPLFGDSRTPSEEHPTATGCTCRKSDCPERHRGKHPIAKGWQKIATADEVELRDQYSERAWAAGRGAW